MLTVKADATATATFVDPRRPYIVTLPATGQAGSKVKLRFRVWDKTGRASERLTVRNGMKILAGIAVPIGHVAYRRIYSVSWLVPTAPATATVRFCAIAVDRAGKRSPSACSLLTIA